MLEERHPYLTTLHNKISDREIVVLIQLISKQHISYYDIKKIKYEDMNLFFSMVQKWWKQEPSMPISLYYKESFDKFDYIKTFIDVKDCEIVSGFQGVQLKNLSEKRIKRKLIKIE